MKLGTQYCPTCDVPIEPQSLDAIAARVMKECKGKHATILAPLVVNRGALHRSRKVGQRQGFAHLRVDGELICCRAVARLDRFAEHNIELPVATVEAAERARRDPAPRWCRASTTAKGVVQVLSWKKGGEEAELTVFSTKQPAQAAAPASPSLIPGCSPSTASMAGVPVAGHWRKRQGLQAR